MPKSKVRKKTYSTAPSNVATSSTGGVSKSAARAMAPSPTWWPILVAVVLLIGLAWIVVYYIAGEHVPVIKSLGGWNFAVGFGFMIVGLILAVRWR